MHSLKKIIHNGPILTMLYHPVLLVHFFKTHCMPFQNLVDVIALYSENLAGVSSAVSICVIYKVA